MLLLAGRITSKTDFCVKVLGGLASDADSERFHCAEGNAALLIAELILKNEGPGASLSYPEAEAGDVIIKDNDLGLIAIKFELANRAGGELHFDIPEASLGTAWEDSGCPRSTSHGVYDS